MRHCKSPWRASRSRVGAGLLLGILLLAACQKMAGEGRYKPLEASDFFADGQSARPIVSGTLPLDAYLPGDPIESGRANGELLADVPVPVDDRVLERGRERFNIYCAPCHHAAGTGNGPVVRRGFPPAPTLLSNALRQAPAGHLYVVIKEGSGSMPNYDIQIPPLDRWAIVAALRSMQDALAPAPQPTVTDQP